MIPVNSIVPAIQEIDMLVPNMNHIPNVPMYEGFSFKETSNKMRNLRRN